MLSHSLSIWGRVNAGPAGLLCSRNLATPVDATETVMGYETVCSSGAVEIDSVAAGDGIVVVNGTWRLT